VSYGPGNTVLIEMCIGLHVKYPLIFPYFKKKTLIFPQTFKNTQISNYMKIHLVGAKLFQAVGGTNREWPDETNRRDKAYGRCLQFCE
jgi:hypothetical protein